MNLLLYQPTIENTHKWFMIEVRTQLWILNVSLHCTSFKATVGPKELEVVTLRAGWVDLYLTGSPSPGLYRI